MASIGSTVGILLTLGCSSGNYPQAKQTVEELLSIIEEVTAILDGIHSRDDADRAAARIDLETVKYTSLIDSTYTLKLTASEITQLKQETSAQAANVKTRLDDAWLATYDSSACTRALIIAMQRFDAATVRGSGFR